MPAGSARAVPQPRPDRARHPLPPGRGHALPTTLFALPSRRDWPRAGKVRGCPPSSTGGTLPTRTLPARARRRVNVTPHGCARIPWGSHAFSPCGSLESQQPVQAVAVDDLSLGPHSCLPHPGRRSVIHPRQGLRTTGAAPPGDVTEEGQHQPRAPWASSSLPPHAHHAGLGSPGR